MGGSEQAEFGLASDEFVSWILIKHHISNTRILHPKKSVVIIIHQISPLKLQFWGIQHGYFIASGRHPIATIEWEHHYTKKNKAF